MSGWLAPLRERQNIADGLTLAFFIAIAIHRVWVPYLPGGYDNG